MNSLQESISKCTVSGNVVSLPKELLDNYAQVRKAFIDAGAIYKRNSFIFPKDAQSYIDQLMGGVKLNRKQSLQEFFTPDDLADYLVELGYVEDFTGEAMLEPSAGQGAIIKAVRRAGYDGAVDWCEVDDINSGVVSRMPGTIFRGFDFMGYKPSAPYGLIIANPPFSKNQDIDHIMHMWEHLADGGRLVSVASTHWRLSTNKKEVTFARWVDSLDSEVFDLGPGKFKSSGTMVESCIITINK